MCRGVGRNAAMPQELPEKAGEPGPTVYVVDDDPAMRSSLRWLIESVGLAVRTCSSAQEFLRTYQPSDPGCLVLDVRMPGMSGLDLQADLVRRGAGPAPIVVPGHAGGPRRGPAAR